MSDLFKKLSGSLNKKKAEKKPERPMVEVPDEALEAFQRLVGAKAVLDVVESRADAEKGIVHEIMLDAFAKTLFDHGTQPVNPRFYIDKDGRDDMTGVFQVQTRFKVNIPEGDESPDERIVQALVFAGIDKKTARLLVNNEVDAEPVVSLRPFNELVNGHYVGKQFVKATQEEQAAGEKLLAMVMGQKVKPLTEDERDLVIRKEDKTKIKGGFFERLASYCESSDEVLSILRVITPTHFVSHMKFGVSDTPEERQSRLIDEAADILGVQDIKAAA